VRALAVAVVLAAAAPARAETPVPPKSKEPDPPPPPSPPDPIVDSVRDANLESAARHQGRNVTLAIGGGFTIGFGIDNSVGRGGGFSARLAQVATPRIALTAEIAAVTLFHQVKGTQMSSDIKRDQDTNLMIGAQFYTAGSLWLRFATGFGVYKAADAPQLAGPAGLLGAGFDIVRSRRVSFGAEFMTIGMINRDGLLSSNVFMFDLSIE